MKTIKYFLAIFAFATLVSCSVEDDNPSVDQSLLVGEWNLEEYNYSGTTKLTQGSNSYSTSYIGEALNLDARVILNSDNTYITAGTYTIKLSSTGNGQTDVQEVPMGNIASSGTYRVEGNKFITDNQPTQPQEEMGIMAINEATIVELTSSRMVLSIDDTVLTEMEGIAIEVKVKAIQVYSR